MNCDSPRWYNDGRFSTAPSSPPTTGSNATPARRPPHLRADEQASAASGAELPSRPSAGGCVRSVPRSANERMPSVAGGSRGSRTESDRYRGRDREREVDRKRSGRFSIGYGDHYGGDPRDGLAAGSAAPLRWGPSERRPISRSRSPEAERFGNPFTYRASRHSYSSANAGSPPALHLSERGWHNSSDHNSPSSRRDFRDRDRHRGRDNPYLDSQSYSAIDPSPPATDTRRADSRRDSGYTSRRSSTSPPRNWEREKSPLRAPKREDPSLPASMSPDPRVWGPRSGGNISADASLSSTSPPLGPDGIPTGPRSYVGRAGAPAWGSGRGGSGGVGPRGRDGGLGIRGRGRVGHGHYNAQLNEDPPARRLARKLDAGGNAVFPDLMPAQAPNGGQTTGKIDDESSLADGEAGEVEEGEAREEGEMMPAAVQDGLFSDAKHGRLATGTQSLFDYSSKGHAEKETVRQVQSPQAGPSTSLRTQVQGGSTAAEAVSSTTLVNSHTTAPNAWAAAQQQQQKGSSETPPTSAGTPATPRARMPLSAFSFPRSVQPEWDAEVFALSHQRLSALNRLPLSTSFSSIATAGAGSALGTMANPATPGANTPLANTPSVESGEAGFLFSSGGNSGIVTTPGVAGPITNLYGASSLKQALLDLREAQMEMEMSAFRRDEVDRARAELV